MHLPLIVVGRKRIKIDLIKDEKFRKITQCKREKGILKKAMELSLLCGSDVLLIIRDQPSQRTLVYNSFPSNNSFNEALLKNECTYSYSNEDV